MVGIFIYKVRVSPSLSLAYEYSLRSHQRENHSPEKRPRRFFCIIQTKLCMYKRNRRRKKKEEEEHKPNKRLILYNKELYRYNVKDKKKEEGKKKENPRQQHTSNTHAHTYTCTLYTYVSREKPVFSGCFFSSHTS